MYVEPAFKSAVVTTPVGGGSRMLGTHALPDPCEGVSEPVRLSYAMGVPVVALTPNT
jgi:hypothetical protein